MKLLKDRIRAEGIILSDSTLKVDTFLNHQIDPQLMKEIGDEIASRYSDEVITKILTIESSGIAPSMMLGLQIGAPVVFARKRKQAMIHQDVYAAKVHSFTKDEGTDIIVAKEFLNADDNVLIVDDLLANGAAVKGLLNIAKQAGAYIVGAAIVIENGFQQGGKQLRTQGVRVESLAIIETLANGEVKFADED